VAATTVKVYPLCATLCVHKAVLACLHNLLIENILCHEVRPSSIPPCSRSSRASSRSIAREPPLSVGVTLLQFPMSVNIQPLVEAPRFLGGNDLV